MKCMPRSNSSMHEPCGQPVAQTHGEHCSMQPDRECDLIESATSSKMVHGYEIMNTGIQRF
jgi:hypothetical protein